MTLRPELLVTAERLAACVDPELSLDAIAEALGTLAIDSDEIEALFVWLEAHGKTIGEYGVGLASAALPQVLATARAMRAELGRTPTPKEIAARSSLGEDAVRRALLFAKILQR
jgi:hypothetical protein